jgi:uncharacterized protein YjbJ (UPF0337 family)
VAVDDKIEGSPTPTLRLAIVAGSIAPVKHSTKGAMNMDKNRIVGAAKQAKGSIEVAAGKVLGDAKLEAEGRQDKAAGKIQNAVGGMKDAVKDVLKK